jgi:nucleotide-binding universal stress UspA family protein
VSTKSTSLASHVARQMSQFFHKILCPIAFDDQCRAALDLAQRVAEQNHARVWVLHVVSPEADSGMGSETGATLRLQKIVEERLHGKVDYEFVVRSGSAADEVLNAAREFGSDLIVIPTHGRVGLKRLVLGSVAECVIRESSIPVLTVRHSDALVR